MSTLWETLRDPAIYRDAIARVLRDAERDPDGQLALLRRDGDRLAARLARELADRTWTQVPLARHIVRADKPREVVRLPVPDRIVHAAVATALVARLEPQLPTSLYSYRPGRGTHQAIRALLASVRAYRQRRISVRERGLFVLRFDVQSYGDTVPLDDASPLWSQLAAVLPDEPPWFLTLLRAMIRGGEERALGLPTGSPLSNPLQNLYLAELDRHLAEHARGSARFGDDVIAIFDDLAGAQRARTAIDEHLAHLRLRANPDKRIDAYWTHPGRPGPPGWRGLRFVRYLGVELGFDGEVRLATARRRVAVSALRSRISSLARHLAEGPQELEARAARLCAALRPAYDLRSPFVVPELEDVLSRVSCRQQLGEIDREVALAAAVALTGVRGPAAFRLLPWRALHAHGLPSLVALRNRGRW